MPQPIKRPFRKRAKRPRLGLSIAKGLDALLQLPEETLSLTEQTILRRIQETHARTIAGKLTDADYLNLRNIAARHRIKLR